MSANAFELVAVTKHFKKRVIRREYTTLKSELVRLLTGGRKQVEPAHFIQALKGSITSRVLSSAQM